MLWTDIMDPVEATAAARVELSEYEAQWGSLARYLPNVATEGDYVKFYVDENGLVDEARYRAFNAPPEVAGGGGGQQVTVNLVAISRNEPIDEKTQRALKRLPDDRVRKSIEAAIRRSVQAVADRNERTRGGLIHSGNVVVTQSNFAINDQYGRDAALTVDAGAGKYWADKTVDRLEQLSTWCDVWEAKNFGRKAGAVLFGKEAWRAYASGNQFATQLLGGAQRLGTRDDVVSVSTSQGVPEFDFYSRSTKSGRVLDPKFIYILPAPGEVESDEPSELGATYFGESLMVDAEGYEAVAESDPPGFVCGVHRENRIPYTVEVESDAITLPVAHRINASMAIKVLA